MAPRRTGEEPRSRILQAAEECFARYGYDATGVAEICRRAGVSKGAFYHHFPSKQALFLEMLESWLGELNARIQEIRFASRTSPQAQVGLAYRLQLLRPKRSLPSLC